MLVSWRVFFSVWHFEKCAFLDSSLFDVTKNAHFLFFLIGVTKKWSCFGFSLTCPSRRRWLRRLTRGRRAAVMLEGHLWSSTEGGTARR